MAAIAFCLKIPSQDTTKVRWTEKLSQLDAPGTFFLVPGVVCLVLALQWGGQIYAVSWPNSEFLFPCLLMISSGTMPES